MSTSTVVTLVNGFLQDILGILYDVIPVVLTAAAILIGISIGVRYAYKWIRKTAK